MDNNRIKILVSADSSFDILRRLHADNLSKRYNRITEVVPATATIVIYSHINTSTCGNGIYTYEARRFVVPIIPNEHTVAEDGYECWIYQHKQSVDLPLNSLPGVVQPDAGATQYTFSINIFMDRWSGKGHINGDVPQRPVRTDLPPERIYYSQWPGGYRMPKERGMGTLDYVEYPITMHTRVEYVELALLLNGG